jgi:hypothetical protein
MVREANVMPMALSDRAATDCLFFIRVGDVDDNVFDQKVERPTPRTWRINDGKELRLIPAVSRLMTAAGFHPI